MVKALYKFMLTLLRLPRSSDEHGGLSVLKSTYTGRFIAI